MRMLFSLPDSVVGHCPPARSVVLCYSLASVLMKPNLADRIIIYYVRYYGGNRSQTFAIMFSDIQKKI